MCQNLRPGEHCRVDENGNKACGPTDHQRAAMRESTRLIGAKMAGVPGAAGRLRTRRERLLVGEMGPAEVRRRLKRMAQTKTAIGPRDELALRLAEKALDKARRRPDGMKTDRIRMERLDQARAARVRELASKMTVLGSDVPDRMPASFSVVSGGAKQPRPERLARLADEHEPPVRVDRLMRPVP